jgi:hypothetical protein
MPLREFECGTCRKDFTEITKNSDYKAVQYKTAYDDFILRCPHCGEQDKDHLHVKEVPTHPSNFALKGMGWFGKSKRTRY